MAADAWERMRNIIFIYCLLSMLCSSAQEEATKPDESEGKFLFMIGLGLNQPKLVKNQPFIRSNFIPDVTFDFAYYTAVGKHGWFFSLGSSTKNYNYQIKNTFEFDDHSQFAVDDWYYNFSIRKTYSYHLTKEITTITSAGPVLIMNNFSSLPDTMPHQQPPPVEIAGIRPFGLAIHVSVFLLKQNKKDRKQFLSFSYQLGFVDFMEARVTSPFSYESAIYRYSATGPAVKYGWMF
jgi:hypothetical protein